MITLVCYQCKRLQQTEGTPCQYSDVWAAAREAGWLVVERLMRGRCYCRTCAQAFAIPESGTTAEVQP